MGLKLKISVLFLLGLISCAPKSPFLVIKYNQEGKLITLEKLTSGTQPAWSADNKIAYTKTGINLTDQSGEETKKLNSIGSRPVFSPDGKYLLFEREKGIWLIDLQTSQTRKLIEEGKQPAFSPDARKIAYVNKGIFIWDIETQTAALLTIDGLNPAWSPDGNFIYFEKFSPSKLKFDIWEFNLADKSSKEIVPDAMGPKIANNGRFMLYSGRGIWLYDLRNKEAIRITAYGYDPAFSPDGSRIIFSYEEKIWIADSPFAFKKGFDVHEEDID